MQSQLRLFTNIFRRENEDIVRSLVFQPSSAKLKVAEIDRKYGCPRLYWAKEVARHAIKIAGDEEKLATEMSNKNGWHKMVKTYLKD